MLTIIGAGLTGATIARLALDDGYRVQVFERRSVVGGNCADAIYENGQRYNLYGPHYFRTSSDKLWTFINRFAEWKTCECIVSSMIDGEIEAFPITLDYVEKHCGIDWRKELLTSEAKNFEEACLRRLPRLVYDKFVYGYTLKQWETDPRNLSAEMAGRVEIREGIDRRLKLDKYQVIPINGYCSFIESMLDGANIYLDTKDKFYNNYSGSLIYTGAIDEFFNYRLGHLPYRTQQRKHRIAKSSYMQLNYPSLDVPHVREIDWTFSWPGPGLVTTETPANATDENDREYPFPSQEARERYENYAILAKEFPNILFAGRLGEYRYYDMDHAITRAMVLYAQWVKPRLLNERI